MIVNHFNTFPYGGAAAAANRIHCSLLDRGIQSRFYYEKSGGEVDIPNAEKTPWVTQARSNSLARYFEKRRVKRIHRQYDLQLANRSQDLELFSMCELESAKYLPTKVFENQIIHLHWVAFLANYPSFFSSISARTPVVWTLHDMNPMTGGCHYSNGCKRFESGCGNCPQLPEPKIKDLSQSSFQIKRRAFQNIDLTVVGPSQWILNLARCSPIFPKHTRFEHVRLGFDLEEFYPMVKGIARQQLSAETNRVVIGFGAESIKNHRKGFDLLLKALALIKNKDSIECFVFGSGGAELNEPGLPRIRNFGFINDSDQLTQFYSACDLVVIPSREDNQPQVGLEAMACGTPVVGFDVGGISEYVLDGETGLLAGAENYQQLASQLDRLVSDVEMREMMSSHCRKMIEQEFDIKSQTAKYLELYSELLSARKAVA